MITARLWYTITHFSSLRCSSSISELRCGFKEVSGQLQQLTSSRFEAWSKTMIHWLGPQLTKVRTTKKLGGDYAKHIMRCSSSISELRCGFKEVSGQLQQLTSSRFEAWSNIPQLTCLGGEVFFEYPNALLLIGIALWPGPQPPFWKFTVKKYLWTNLMFRYYTQIWNKLHVTSLYKDHWRETTKAIFIDRWSLSRVSLNFTFGNKHCPREAKKATFINIGSLHAGGPL